MALNRNDSNNNKRAYDDDDKLATNEYIKKLNAEDLQFMKELSYWKKKYDIHVAYIYIYTYMCTSLKSHYNHA